MSVTENADLTIKSQNENQAEIALEYDEESSPDDLSVSDSAPGLPGEPDTPKADDSGPDMSGANDDALLVEDSAAVDGIGDEAAADEITQESETLPDGNAADINDQPESAMQAEPPKEIQADDFGGWDDDETADVAAQQQQPKSRENIEASDALEAPTGAAGFSLAEKIISGALMALIIGGFVLYSNPSWIGLNNTQKPATPVPVAAIETVVPVGQPVTTPPAPSERDQCLAKIEEAVRLRNVLLAKNEEIYDLDLHYRHGIAELEAETYRELKQAGTTSYEAAMKNKRIELNMRTIHRRRAYIEGLIRPALWLNGGSEELLYLVRKAQLAMLMTDIAGGIDLKKHVRHIDAAIQKYRPSPDKLAVDPQQSKVQPLEKIWQQVSRREPAGGHEEKIAQFTLNPKDKRIINQICSGNLERISELTNISSRAARCLARAEGSGLFLNGLMTLSPEAARQLFQWPGNWICLNGLKHLSPAAGQYLFRWQGNWISLNSLNDFPPELAKHLLKWEGRQLELMGLKYNQNEANQKTLKYLALWETTGGKLFVNDKIRQEMENLM